MKISSPAFENNQEIPDKYTCNGEGINPALIFQEIPKDTQSLALIIDDPDAPIGTFTHWVLWNINPETTEISENSQPSGALSGTNTANETKYVAPCPPSGTHHYNFKLYALDSKIDLPAGSSVQDLEKAMASHILDSAKLIGLYSHK